MARAPKVYSVLVTADNPTADGVEEVVATLTGVAAPWPDTTVRLLGAVAATGAVGTTTLTVRVRRDGLAGAVVGEAVVTQIAGAVSVTAPIAVQEDRGELTGQAYVLTAAIAGAAATVTAAELIALVA